MADGDRPGGQVHISKAQGGDRGDDHLFVRADHHFNEQGIVQTTKDNAERFLGGFLESLGYQSKITFEAPLYCPEEQ